MYWVYFVSNLSLILIDTQKGIYHSKDEKNSSAEGLSNLLQMQFLCILSVWIKNLQFLLL